MGDLVHGGLMAVPIQDCNYKGYLSRATDEQLKTAVRLMEESPKGHKGRIAACKRELRKRAKGE